MPSKRLDSGGAVERTHHQVPRGAQNPTKWHLRRLLRLLRWALRRAKLLVSVLVLQNRTYTVLLPAQEGGHIRAKLCGGWLAIDFQRTPCTTDHKSGTFSRTILNRNNPDCIDTNLYCLSLNFRIGPNWILSFDLIYDAWNAQCLNTVSIHIRNRPPIGKWIPPMIDY